MVLKDEMLARLRRTFDLNLYEVKIWVALLSRGVSTAGELSNMAGVPRSRTYDILESLERKGFIVMKLGKPIQYIAIPPKDVVDRSKKNVKENAKEKINKLDKIKTGDMVKTLEGLYSNGINFIEPTELSGALKGRSNIYSRLESMIKGAKKSVVMTTSEEGLSNQVNSLKGALREANKKGVKIKIAAPLKKKGAEHVKDLKKVAELKHTKDINSRFAVVDGKQAVLFMLNDEELHPNYDIGVWLNSQPVAGTLNHMFDHMWGNLPKK